MRVEHECVDVGLSEYFERVQNAVLSEVFVYILYVRKLHQSECHIYGYFRCRLFYKLCICSVSSAKFIWRKIRRMFISRA